MPDPRFKAPEPKAAQKRRAAVLAFLNDGKPGFGVRKVDPNELTPIERAKAAYAKEPTPANLNWLKSLAGVKPGDVPNYLASMVKGVARDPVGAMMPIPGGGAAKELARVAKMKAYLKERSLFDSKRMRKEIEFLAQKRTAFDAGLQPPPVRLTPQREYVIKQKGRGVDVLSHVDRPPAQVTAEQARAAGVMGPEAMPVPAGRFTRSGSRADVEAPVVNRKLAAAAGGDDVSVKFAAARDAVERAPRARMEPDFESDTFSYRRNPEHVRGEPNSTKIVDRVQQRTTVLTTAEKRKIAREIKNGNSEWKHNPISDRYYKEEPLRDVLAYDAEGKLVGVSSHLMSGTDAGAFKISVRPDAQRKGVGSRVLDAAHQSGIDIPAVVGKNNYTESGRSLLKSWLGKRSGK